MGRAKELVLTERTEKQLSELLLLFSSRSDVVRQAVAAFHKDHRAEIREKKEELQASEDTTRTRA